MSAQPAPGATRCWTVSGMNASITVMAIRRGTDTVHVYHAAYHKTDGGWYVAKVLDFPGALSQRRTWRSAPRMIRDALRMLAEALMEAGQTLPRSNPKAHDR